MKALAPNVTALVGEIVYNTILTQTNILRLPPD